MSGLAAADVLRCEGTLHWNLVRIGSSIRVEVDNGRGTHKISRDPIIISSYNIALNQVKGCRQVPPQCNIRGSVLFNPKGIIFLLQLSGGGACHIHKLNNRGVLDLENIQSIPGSVDRAIRGDQGKHNVAVLDTGVINSTINLPRRRKTLYVGVALQVYQRLAPGG